MDLPDYLTRWPRGEIMVTGHRIGLLHVVDRHNEGMSAEEIARDYPSLAIATIEDVVAFYRENRGEVDAYVAGCRAEIDRQAAEPSTGPTAAELRRRIEARQRSGTA